MRRVLQYQYMYEFMPQNERNYAFFFLFILQPLLGTNPISLAAPAAPCDDFVLDMATTTVALGKVNSSLGH